MDPKQLDLAGNELGNEYTVEIKEQQRRNEDDCEVSETRKLHRQKLHAPNIGAAISKALEAYEETDGVTVTVKVCVG